MTVWDKDHLHAQDEAKNLLHGVMFHKRNHWSTSQEYGRGESCVFGGSIVDREVDMQNSLYTVDSHLLDDSLNISGSPAKPHDPESGKEKDLVETSILA
jgi:hypothetical protein